VVVISAKGIPLTHQTAEKGETLSFTPDFYNDSFPIHLDDTW
jgi:hypothetical protein